MKFTVSGAQPLVLSVMIATLCANSALVGASGMRKVLRSTMRGMCVFIIGAVGVSWLMYQ